MRAVSKHESWAFLNMDKLALTWHTTYEEFWIVVHVWDNVLQQENSQPIPTEIKSPLSGAFISQSVFFKYCVCVSMKVHINIVQYGLISPFIFLFPSVLTRGSLHTTGPQYYPAPDLPIPVDCPSLVSLSPSTYEEIIFNPRKTYKLQNKLRT